jgi:hypothetical protein
VANCASGCNKCYCKNGADGAIGPTGADGAHTLDGLLHIVDALPDDPLTGNLYFIADSRNIYLGDAQIMPRDLERFIFFVQTDDGMFDLLVNKRAEGIPYEWNLYLDKKLYTTASGVTEVRDTPAVAATFTGLDENIHEIWIEPIADIKTRMVPYGWLVAMGYYCNHADSECQAFFAEASKIVYCNCKITKRAIAENDTSIANNALGGIFAHAVNLRLGPDFGLTESCDEFTTAGDYDFDYTFDNCVSLVTLPDGFHLPKNLEVVGTDFCDSMFRDCKALVKVPEGFTFPPNITSAGKDFASDMFRFCNSIVTFPDGFNLPQKFTSVGDDFADDLFEDCMSLESLPKGFNLPPNLLYAGNYFCGLMFRNCDNLVDLPEGFNLPQNLESVGKDFVKDM